MGKEIEIYLGEKLEIHLDSTQVLPDGTVYHILRMVGQYGDLSFHIYPKDHNPPHFHVQSKQRGIDARFSIQTLRLINEKYGKIKQTDIRKVQDFFQSRPEMHGLLISEFNRLK